MKIIYFTKYTSKAASSRMRSYQYEPFLKIEDIRVVYSPLFSDEYLDRLYSGKKISIWGVFKAYLFRFFKLFTVGKYNRVIIEKELFPYMPAWCEILLSVLGVKYIIDYDDAIFHHYDLSQNTFIRTFLKNKIKSVVRYSALVIAGNQYLADYAIKAKAKKVEIIPTVVSKYHYRVKTDFENDPVVIGWIGSPTTFRYLKDVKNVLNRLIKKYDVSVHIVGAGESLGLVKNEVHIAWDENTEAESILGFDIGIMPLDDTPWAKGKCAYKLIQYMACGIPVMASPVGMNCEVVKSEWNGYLADSQDEWFGCLENLLQDRAKMKKFGYNGKVIADNNYTIQAVFPKYLSLIKNLE